RRLSEITKPDDWLDPQLAEQVGPPLPQGGIAVVQASGGHQRPQYFVSDGIGLWKLDAGAWRRIVPGGPVGRQAFQARRFGVDPFNPSLIYIRDSGQFRLSLDGGASWIDDVNLTGAVTGNRKLSLANAFRDMLFVRSGNRRFVFGTVGILMTDNGIDWHCVCNSIAMPGLPEAGFHDGVSNPSSPALYVVLEGRGLVRLDLVAPPPPAPARPPHPP